MRFRYKSTGQKTWEAFLYLAFVCGLASFIAWIVQLLINHLAPVYNMSVTVTWWEALLTLVLTFLLFRNVPVSKKD